MLVRSHASHIAPKELSVSGPIWQGTQREGDEELMYDDLNKMTGKIIEK